jgi:hypothetical protein
MPKGQDINHISLQGNVCVSMFRKADNQLLNVETSQLKSRFWMQDFEFRMDLSHADTESTSARFLMQH